MNRTVTVKMAVYFFCIISGALLCAMELELKKSHDYCVVKKALLCAEIMEKHEMPHEITAIVKRDSYFLRMDTIYKKFDPFFHFDEPNCYQCFNVYIAGAKGLRFNRDICQAAQKYAQENCRKFDVVMPRHLFFFTDNYDEILGALVSRPGCFIHHQGNCRIELTWEEREKYLMLPAEFRNVLNKYPRSYVDKK